MIIDISSLHWKSSLEEKSVVHDYDHLVYFPLLLPSYLARWHHDLHNNIHDHHCLVHLSF
jgi:hypothetical protein